MSETMETAFGNIQIEKELKSNVHDSVYLARNVQVIRRCIYREFEGNGDVYRTLGRLRSPHLPEVFDVKEENGRVSALEEYIQGDTLAFLLEEKPLSEDTAGDILCQLCNALELLHGAGVVHRDIKPENIMMRGKEAVLIDFDVSRMVKPEHDTDTRIMGTTGYAAPEQYGFSQTDARADIYAMGILLNEMLTKQHPSKHLAQGRFRPVIERCIEVNVDKRYATAAELREAVIRCSEKKSRKPAVFGTLAGLAAVLVLVLLFALLPRGAEQPPETEPMLQETAGTAETVENSEPATMEVFPRQAIEISQDPWPGTAAGFTTPFSYDLDGDGEMEDYIFGTFHANVPAGHRHTLGDSFGLAKGESSTRTVYPCVWQRDEEGQYELVMEFADLLTDPQTQVWRANGTDSPAPDAFTIQDRWKGGVEVIFTVENQGFWLYEVSATLNGHELTAATSSSVFDINQMS